MSVSKESSDFCRKEFMNSWLPRGWPRSQTPEVISGCEFGLRARKARAAWRASAFDLERSVSGDLPVVLVRTFVLL